MKEEEGSEDIAEAIDSILTGKEAETGPRRPWAEVSSLVCFLFLVCTLSFLRVMGRGVPWIFW